MEEKVILVDPNDNPIGLMEKMEAHQKGLLHRAFSVFAFNEKGETLLQQRAKSKYHSPLLWSNTCCSHPRENETTIQAAIRRMREEMGVDCMVKPLFTFIYKVELDQGMTEHELDHVFEASFEGTPNFNPEEVASFRWISLQDLEKEMTENPEDFTQWFRIIFSQYKENLNRWK
ncbi:MAG: isopentenyl-diphosphate delta-isomerase [Flavobacteriaceae bacterium]|nr:MAG: isopentenyl-diphosphate delta-isomerase [Flavobacteriaceae bacterium]